ncbi:hypothetical protein [Dichelobacter nodosus]|uniref:hypothetical protein n=1 Tax=Dichelobacter nodosus TaxID=870 RepID=UPI0002EE5B9D|nr:hypothetical protein [Dichelobacter nodosus]
MRYAPQTRQNVTRIRVFFVVAIAGAGNFYFADEALMTVIIIAEMMASARERVKY